MGGGRRGFLRAGGWVGIPPSPDIARRTTRFNGKRQVPSFALLELGRRIETRVEANNAKGGSS